MALFLVRMELKLPPALLVDKLRRLYADEAQAAQPYLDSGEFARVWRIPGTRNHIALWDVADVQTVHDAYTSFPMFPFMTITVEPLCVNPNDPGTPATDAPDVRFTWAGLNAVYQADAGHQASGPGHAHGEGKTVMITPDISIHQHPGSAAPAEFHVMYQNTKIAEVGPDENLQGEEKAPGYVDFLAEWDGQPVLYRKWKARIAADNRVLHPNYEAALDAPRAWF